MFTLRRIAPGGHCTITLFVLAGIFLSAISPSRVLSEETPDLQSIASASLEDLLNMDITSVSKIPEDIRRVSASVGIVTRDDIRRNGATAVAELLRLVPGVNVARREQNKWAVSIRGFNSRTSNNILVMVDGRSVYDPLFSGTLWEMRDIPLEEIEQIEVVRGPGGSSWGSNAANGVINIITRHAKDTQGNLISVLSGNEDKLITDVRHGGVISNDTYYRIYSRYLDRDSGYLDDGASDDSYHGQIGFRLDSRTDASSNAMLAGNIYRGSYEGTGGDFNNVAADGGWVQARWNTELSKLSQLSLNTYYEHFDLRPGILGEVRDTGEFNIQNDTQLNERLTLVSSFQYRFTTDEIISTPVLAVEPDTRQDNWISAGLTTKTVLIKDTLDMRLGAKVEHNDYSSLEFQPDAGLSWTINPHNTLWASVSKAVRIPSRLESDLIINIEEPVPATIRGNRDLDSEELIAYQAGYRASLMKDLIFSFNSFYYDYDQLIAGQDATLKNSAKGSSYGGEIATRLKATDWWYMVSGYSYLESDFERDHGAGGDPGRVASLEGNTPHHQFFLNSRFDIGERWKFDSTIRFTDNLYDPHVPSYVVADLRLAYAISKDVELSVAGQNLFERRHFERGESQASQVEQAVYGKIRWNF